jgi:hypothetical protein
MDSRKCQTATASPAEPGELPVGLGFPANWIVTDIVRMEDGVFVEHWDVIQDEATKEQSKSGHPMFGDTFPW